LLNGSVRIGLTFRREWREEEALHDAHLQTRRLASGFVPFVCHFRDQGAIWKIVPQPLILPNVQLPVPPYGVIP
jgi:hypothetical protein